MQGNTMTETPVPVNAADPAGSGKTGRQGANTETFVPEGELLDTPENRAATADMCALRAAAEEGRILEACCVLCDCPTMELTVEFSGGMRGVIPHEEVCWTRNGSLPRDIAVITRVGKPVQIRITGFRNGPRDTPIAVCSRKTVQRDCAENRLSRLMPGDLIPARVTHLEPFGAFCDIGAGIAALLPVDRVSVSRVSHPADRFRVGERIRTAVLSKTEDGRIYLTHREFLGTWEQNAALFSAGQTVRGIIRSVEDYGVFIELAPNLAGLAEPSPEASPGRRCSVYIKSILPERMKIKLVLIDVGEPASPAPGRLFPLSDAIEGTPPRLLRWQYSPEGCGKQIVTVFGEE